ncbi:MAG: TetR/AcrR family transcriptional regulator [Rikenellaceae bacterium]
MQRESIIILAEKMFVAQGIKAVRMDDIAHEAGISKRTLYEIFGDKDELLFQAMKLYFDRMEQQNNEVALESPNVLIATLRVMQNVVKHSEISWRLRNAMQRFHKSVNERISEERNDRGDKLFKRGLQQGVDEGLLVPYANLDLAISMLKYMSRSVVLHDSEFRMPEGVTPQEAFLEVAVIFMRGIATQKGIEIIDEFVKNSDYNLKK